MRVVVGATYGRSISSTSAKRSLYQSATHARFASSSSIRPIWWMPDMGGLMLAAEIRRRRDAQALPLVLLTSLGWREGAAVMEGIHAFLSKPLKLSKLQAVLVNIFKERSGGALAVPQPQSIPKQEGSE